MMSEHWSEEQTDDPHYADQRNFYKVERWSRDGIVGRGPCHPLFNPITTRWPATR
jgi:hypothetical protein